MDPSALIFVALAVAWAVYLVPKALEHHEEGARTRTVDRFSAGLRVLARREPISRRKARLVAPGPPSSDASGSSARRRSSRAASPAAPDAPTAPITPITPAVPTAPLSAAQQRTRRLAAAGAAKRRLRVVSVILVLNAAVAGLAAAGVVDWVWCAAPVGVLVAWLVACRIMVKRERAELRPQRSVRRTAAVTTEDRPGEGTEETARVDAPLLEEPAADADPDAEATRAPGSWDPVPVTLPTYVTKAVAPRSVSTIDLDSTGVWSSGHNASDSALAREAEAADAAARDASGTARRRRASGS